MRSKDRRRSCRGQRCCDPQLSRRRAVSSWRTNCQDACEAHHSRREWYSGGQRREGLRFRAGRPPSPVGLRAVEATPSTSGVRLSYVGTGRQGNTTSAFLNASCCLPVKCCAKRAAQHGVYRQFVIITAGGTRVLVPGYLYLIRALFSVPLIVPWAGRKKIPRAFLGLKENCRVFCGP